MLFKNRQEAGKQLAEALKKYKSNPRAIILGLPRGGVVVAAEAARTLRLPLDILVPRKISAPGSPELAIGAISEEGEGIFDNGVIQSWGISQEYINQEIIKEKAEAERRLKLYRAGKPELDLKNKIAIIIDDGLATGATMLAAIASAKLKGAINIVAAIPVAASDALEKIEKAADETICLETPLFFNAVGAFYEDFEQVEDAEVIHIDCFKTGC